MTAKQTAKDSAHWYAGDDAVVLDHASLQYSDLEWLAPAKRLTLWAVKVPEGLFAELPNLEWLDLRGGSAPSADVIRGCAGLRYLQLNQIRGLRDLSAVSEASTLECLSLYGMPQVTQIPSLAGLDQLARVEIGSMKGLSTIGPLLDAPALRELLLIRKVGLDAADPDRIRDKPGLELFEWFAEDVPYKVWAPVMETVAKPKAKAMHAEDWFAQRD